MGVCIFRIESCGMADRADRALCIHFRVFEDPTEKEWASIYREPIQEERKVYG